jgi:cold shock protein
MSSQWDRIESMLRALCAHLGVQSLDRSGNGAQESFDLDGGPRYTGVVSRFEHGWGFIECEAMNRNFFVHYSDIEGTGLRSLDPGEVVSFELAPGKDGRPKAVRVRRQTAGRAVPRPTRTLGISRSDAVSGIPTEEPEGTGTVPDGTAVPEPGRSGEGEP